jgi:tetratricopeptide (TPR) repeat protein
LLSRAYALAGKFNQAFETLEKANDSYQSPASYKYYYDEIKKLQDGDSSNQSAREDSYLRQQSNNIKREDQRNNSRAETERDVDPSKAVEDRLDQLAETISSAKIQRVKEDEDPELSSLFNLSENNMIISETLAEIYLAQGEYKEAVKVYERLIKKNPEKGEYFTNKIRVIQTRFDS